MMGMEETMRKRKAHMPPRAELRDVDRAIIQAVMFEQGILPMEKTHFDMRRVLAQLSPDEARVLKRKFRKLWRQAMKKEVNGASQHRRESRNKILSSALGVGKPAPTREQRQARKQLVFNALWQELIAPLIEKFENGGETPSDTNNAT